ncbi:hypothetical protein C7S18_08505 [Ahniella affigens]|uniref:Cytochrome c domain-containing protein n=1 Tax=Ahniella affigens TaxID=2021234 RepID=A0A2P1PQV7_9GAMM|nr:cytochrome c [Ahniella affigens]AVP97233.1 hypothetical protein C7S18_08505 [Ahniella affigens]
MLQLSLIPRVVAPWLGIPFALATALAPQIGLAADGKALFEATCIACHGATGQGTIPGVPDLKPRMTKSDKELIRSILDGFQTSGSPMAMPAKGGNPKLTEADAQALVTYLRQLTTTSSPPPDPAPASDSQTVPAEAGLPAGATPIRALSDAALFARGAKAWAETCARCHAMRDPKDLTDAQWTVAVTHMRLRAGLDGQTAREITDFLTSSN